MWSSPIDWGELSGARFSADVTMEWDCETVYTPNDCGEFSSPVAVMNMMPKMMKPVMTQFSSNFKSALFCLHSSAHSSGCIDIMLFREPRATALFCLLPNRGGWRSTDSGSLFDSWATSVLVGFNMDRAGGSDWRKNKV